LSKFPSDAPKAKVIHALKNLGFEVIRQGKHISLQRKNPDNTLTPMTIPNHRRIKGSTLRTICTQAGIKREDFINAFKKS
jgi:predicted RNA binding protein YcfA (HicA-like mRNA interferase family)